ncbi:MAG TPA: ABC transporter substrate-binding protein [Chthonomonadaceae bacterium]|nr:ABC transporter substrate-binding protein [Chthonomonadaceae bacterium]
MNRRPLSFRMTLLLLAVLLAAGTFALPGCSDNPYPPGESAGNVLYTSLLDDPKTLDPTIAYSAEDDVVICLLYSSYFHYNFLKRDPFVLEPDLGATMPRQETTFYAVQEKGRSVRKPGEKWIFSINHGLHFQNDPCFPGGKGREVTAADFLFAFRRMADPTAGFPLLDSVEDKILGMQEYVDYCAQRHKQRLGMDYDKPIAGLQLDPKDPYTFSIVLQKPYPQLRYIMAMHFTAPQAREAVLRYGSDLARHPVGCGPFQLSEYHHKQSLVLTASPYRPPLTYPTEGMPGDAAAGLLQDAGKPVPLVNKIVFTVIREPVTAWNLFLQGYLDAAAVSQTNYQQVMSHPGELSPEMKRKGIKLYRSVAADLFYFFFNMEDPTFGGYTPQKRKLRQAISLAVDSQAYIDLLYLGLGKQAQFAIPPSIFGYDPTYRNPYRQYNVARARQLLAEAGYPGGIDPKTGNRLTLYFDNYFTTANFRQIFGLFKKQMDAIGVRVVSRTYRYNVYQDKINNGEIQFSYYGWSCDYPDPENFLFLLYGPNKGPGPNYARYANPEYDRLFVQVRSMEDTPARAALIRRMRAIVQEDCPWICEQHSQVYAITHAWLFNIKSHPIALDTAIYRRVDGPQRARLQAAWNRPNYAPAVGLALFLIVGSLPALSVIHHRRNRRVRRKEEVAG